MFSVYEEHIIKSIKTTPRWEADINPTDEVTEATYCSSSHIRWMREVHIVEQEQDGVQSVVFFGLAFLPSTKVTKKKTQVNKANLNA